MPDMSGANRMLASKLILWKMLLAEQTNGVRARVEGVRRSLDSATTKRDRQYLSGRLSTVELLLDCLVEDLENEYPPVKENYLTKVENDQFRLMCDQLYRWLLDEAKFLQGQYQGERALRAVALAEGLHDVRRKLLADPDRPITQLRIPPHSG